MDVIAGKNKETKKLRLITSFLIITLSIVLLYYSIENYKIIILIIIILIIKIVDVYLLLKRIKSG